MEFNESLWPRFRAGVLAVNCRTEEAAKEFLNILKSKGFLWTSGESLDDTNFNINKENTCYLINKIGYSKLYYDDVRYLEDVYEIVEYIPSNNTKSLHKLIPIAEAILKLKEGYRIQSLQSGRIFSNDDNDISTVTKDEVKGEWVYCTNILTFEEAMTQYADGVVIISYVTGRAFHKIPSRSCSILDIKEVTKEEIKGEWGVF